MPRVSLSVADVARLITNLQPTGDAWPAEADSVQQQGILALAAPMQTLNDRANYLVTDAFPSTSVELLPEWEASLGLPDPCIGGVLTVALRQGSVVAKLIARGGQSIPYFITIAAALGAAVTIEEFAPFRADSSGADDPSAGDDWASAWIITMPPLSPTAWLDRSVECSLTRYAPAQTVVYFEYPLSGTAGLLDLVGVAGTSTTPPAQNIIGIIP